MNYYISADPNIGEKQITIDLPASKSLSNRALILKALCEDDCQLSHLSDCDDTRVMLQAFEGDCKGSNGEPRIVDIGAAGTSMRFLTAYFATKEGAEVIMTGTERMKQRPIGILVNALRELGAEISYTEQEGFPPLRISGKRLEGGSLSIDGSTSSQYISALLMIAPRLTQGLQLTLTGNVTSRPYIEMTRQMMQEFGVSTEWISDNCINIAPQSYKAKAYAVESDWSASSYWYQICCLYASLGNHCTFTLKGLKPNSLQGDSHIADFFAELNVQTRFTDEGAIIDGSQIVERYKVAEPLYPEKVEWNLANQPDLAQTLIVTCCALDISFDITGLHTLRIKETDRIAALQTELKKFGCLVEVDGDDRMTYDARNGSVEGEDMQMVATYHDHRMAMAFAPIAIVYGSFYICNPEVVSKSYPTFWDDLRLAGFQIEEHPESEEEIRQRITQVSAKQRRVHSHAKWVLNTLLVLCAVLLVFGIVKCS